VKGLSIIIPIYKEKENFENLIKKIYLNLKKIKKNKKNFEVIFIDDSSEDGVGKIYNLIKKRYKGLRLLFRKHKPRDLSKSCIFGFEKSKFDNLLVMDGDLQHDPKYIPFLYKKIMSGDHDIVIGVRNFKKRKTVKINFLRFILSKFLIIIINLLLGKKTEDPMSGYFIFKKKIYLNSKKKLFAKGYKILFDLIYSSHYNLKIYDKKIIFKSRTQNVSKLGTKILLYIIQFIIIKFLTSHFIFKKGR